MATGMTDLSSHYQIVKPIKSIEEFVDRKNNFLQKATHIMMKSGVGHHILLSEADYYEKIGVVHLQYVHKTPRQKDGKKSYGLTAVLGCDGDVKEEELVFSVDKFGESAFIRGDYEYFLSLQSGKWIFLDMTSYPHTPEKREEAITTARSKVGASSYSLIENNCEAFINEVLIKNGTSARVIVGTENIKRVVEIAKQWYYGY